MPWSTAFFADARWGEAGAFTHIMAVLAAVGAGPRTVMIDATYLKAHRMAARL